MASLTEAVPEAYKWESLEWWTKLLIKPDQFLSEHPTISEQAEIEI